MKEQSYHHSGQKTKNNPKPTEHFIKKHIFTYFLAKNALWIYITTSPTVAIFFASASGILIPALSSSSKNNSKDEKESTPKSSFNRCSNVIFSAFTPITFSKLCATRSLISSKSIFFILHTSSRRLTLYYRQKQTHSIKPHQPDGCAPD